MGKNLAQKIIGEHLVSGEMVPGQEVAIAIDQALTQDATGPVALLEFEALGLPQARVKLAVNYADHNLLQVGQESAEDHRFLQTFSAKYGMYFSRPGNGICHQVHLERFAMPGQTLLGADSHTCMAGALGMLAIGAGGLDVAVAMGGGPYYLVMPRVVRVELKGRLGPWVAAKDVVLELLRRLTAQGGTGKIFEYGGEGVASLTVPQRATIANMTVEMNATASLFPSDEQARAYLRAQGRSGDFRPLAPDPDAPYDELIEMDLSCLEPLVACPSNPDKVRPVSEVGGTKLAQVCMGSCQNSFYSDLMTLAAVLKGRKVHPEVSVVVTPGSRQVLAMLARNGALADLVAAGVRVLEVACGPCIGMGQAPPAGGASLRTYNRNFQGRSGTPNDQVYLASPQVAAASALTGVITDPRLLGEPPHIPEPRRYLIDDSLILPPAAEPEKVEVVRGPNIKPLPLASPLPDRWRGKVLLKVGDNISTDHILPAGARVLPLRSNIPALAGFVFERIDPTFPERARKAGGGFVVGGLNYGQGSSREHAALAPMYLGLRAVLARSFARIHRDNLVNFGILPLTLESPGDYEALEQGDELEIPEIHSRLKEGKLLVRNMTKGKELRVTVSLSPRQVEVLRAGGLLNWVRAGAERRIPR